MASSTGTQTPNELKRILCLANSRKYSGRCLAGREIVEELPGPWIRPVSDRKHQEVSEFERHYKGGIEPMVLDVIGVPLVKPCPNQYQQENWLLDPKFYWRKFGRLDWDGLQAFVDPAKPLWHNLVSSYNGLNDRVPEYQAAMLKSSLRLIHVDALTIRVFCPGANFNNFKRKVQGQFQHDGIEYHLSITDPVYEVHYLAQPNGIYNLGECCLTVSLGEPYGGYAYKLIAAIIERDETEEA